MNNKNIVFFLYLFFKYYSHVLCYSVTCDFELSECGWELGSIWQIFPSGSTPETASSGPTMDHTTGSGNYARFMASLLSESNQFGIMSVNTVIQQSTAFSFWYFMHGTQIGTLALIVNDQTLWEKSGRQGTPAWYQADVTLSAGVDVNITFVANITGSGRSSDIAIDDIVLQGEPMSLSTRTTRSRPTTTPRTRFNASCDFDVDKELCGWKSDTNYGWKVINRREPNITIGPSSDYSSITRANVDGKICKIPYDEKGDQYYCMLNSNKIQCKGNDNKWIDCRDGGFLQIRSGEFDQVGERSQFDSPILDALSEEGCVQFQYNIAGTDNDRLNVYVKDYWSGNQSCVWYKNGATIPNQWITAEAPLNLEKDGKYLIVFEARKGKAGGMGLVSLDHIIVSSRPCSGTYPVEECPFEEMIIETTTMISTEDLEVTTAAATTTTVCSICTSSATITLINTTVTSSATITSINTTVTSSSTVAIVTQTQESTNETETTQVGEQNPPTTSTNGSKKTLILAIVLGVLGGLVVISAVVAGFIWRSTILSRLGIKQSNRISMTPTYQSTSGGTVQIDGTTNDSTHP